MSTGSTQAQRSAATRRKLIDAAYALFAERGYTDVSTEEIVRSAGVTRGAMYHQFADKTELFAALAEELDIRLVETIGTRALAELTRPVEALVVATQAFLDEVSVPAVRQILLVDAPSVLGYARWREIGLAHGLGLVMSVLDAGMDAGVIRRLPVRATAHLLVGAIDEAALFIANADDPAEARAAAEEVVIALLDSLRA